MADAGTVDEKGRPPDAHPKAECPKGIPEHEGRAKRYWNTNQRIWFTLCIDCKSDRRRETVAYPELKGHGQTPGKQPKEVANAKWEKVAAMVGAGLTDSMIGEKLSLRPAYVQTVRTQRIHENQRLTEILEDARLQRQQKVVPQALDVVEQLVGQISERANGYEEDAVSKDGVVTVKRMPGPKDLAPALREVANVAGLTRGGEYNSQSAQAQPGGTQITINQIVVDAKTQQAVMQQLWGWRKELAAKKREAALMLEPPAIEGELVTE